MPPLYTFESFLEFMHFRRLGWTGIAAGANKNPKDGMVYLWAKVRNERGLPERIAIGIGDPEVAKTWASMLIEAAESKPGKWMNGEDDED